MTVLSRNQYTTKHPNRHSKLAIIKKKHVVWFFSIPDDVFKINLNQQKTAQLIESYTLTLTVLRDTIVNPNNPRISSNIGAGAGTLAGSSKLKPSPQATRSCFAVDLW